MTEKCKHDWIKLVNINKQVVWYLIFVYLRELSGLNAKQLSVAMSNIRKYYRDITHNNTEFFLFKAEYI